MTKASTTRKQKKLGIIAPVKRNMLPEEVLELQEMQRLVNARKFEAAQIKGNTALIPRGQEIAKEIEAIASLLDNAKNLWISQKLTQCGYSDGVRCNINLTTGEIIPSTEARAK